MYERRLINRVEVDENGCWRWTGPLAPNGYGGTIRAWRKGWLPHRLAFTVMVGEIVDANQIDHLCRVRNCINPVHLEQVTQAENLRRQGAAVTHCPRGHEYTAANTYRSTDNLRRCRECARIRSREAVRRKRNQAA
ncbi:HNH endonuclease [Mycobacterium sp. E1747]|uniref:HNH endonuclease n=1 Tax=Mycobacterium sp. E1747 TaxID=1834128 RepID=UPI003512F807